MRIFASVKLKRVAQLYKHCKFFMSKEEVLLKIKNIINSYRGSNFPDYINCVDAIETLIDDELS